MEQTKLCIHKMKKAPCSWKQFFSWPQWQSFFKLPSQFLKNYANDRPASAKKGIELFESSIRFRERELRPSTLILLFLVISLFLFTFFAPAEETDQNLNNLLEQGWIKISEDSISCLQILHREKFYAVYNSELVSEVYVAKNGLLYTPKLSLANLEYIGSNSDFDPSFCGEIPAPTLIHPI